MANFNTRTVRGLNTRFIPLDAVEVNYPEVNAVVYLTKHGAIAYSGKRTNNDFNYGFSSPESRDSYVANYIEGLKRTIEYKAKRQAEKKLPHTLVIGDIMVNSWGYEQTNVDFYQVVAVTKSTVKLRPICGNLTQNHFMSGTTVAVKDSFCGDEVLTKRVNKDNYASMSCGCLSKWDGRPMHRSWYA